MSHFVTCPVCNGEGSLGENSRHIGEEDFKNDTCPRCGGSKFVEEGPKESDESPHEIQPPSTRR